MATNGGWLAQGVWIPDDTDHPGHERIENQDAFVFDSGAPDEKISVTFIWPADYASGPELDIFWSDTAASAPGASVDTVRWTARLAAVTPNVDSQDMEAAPGFDTIVELDDEADNTNVRALMKATVAITNTDSVAAGDSVTLEVSRNGDHANDTLAGDAAFRNAYFRYTI